MSLFTGSGVALVTPFKKDGSGNFDKLRELVEFHIENGTDALIICGTTGEVATLSDEDQIECIRVAVEESNKRIPVIAGAGSNVTEHAIKLAQGCEKVGADGLLIVTPYYNKTTQKGLIKHYTAIAASTSLPIIVYNVPSRTGLNIDPKTCIELSKIKNIVGIKEASGNIGNVAKIAASCPGFDIYSGNDDETIPICSLGGIGVISVLANVAPRETHDMVQKFLDGDAKGAMEMQLKYLDLANDLFLEVNPMPVKAAMNLMGFDVGECHAPLTDMEEGNLEKLKATLKRYGLIK